MTRSEIIKSKVILAIRQVTRRLFGISFWAFHVLILGLSVLQNGLWYSPQTVLFWLASKDIFRNPFLGQADNEWALSSFLGPALAYFTSTNRSILSYSLLHLVVFVVGFTALTLVIRHQYGDFVARASLIVFFLSPLSNVLFTWLGSPDTLTTLLSMAIVVSWNNSWALPICGFLLGVNHPEQGSIILLLLTLFSLLTRTRRETIQFALTGMGALLVGALALQWYFFIHHFEVLYTRVEYILLEGPFPYVKATFSQPFALVFSLYNVLLLFIIGYLAYYSRNRKIARAFVVYSVLAFMVMLVTLDQTRVFAILTYPAVLLLVLSPSFQHLEPADREFFEILLGISFLIGILIPRFTVFNGNVFFSAYPDIIGFLHNPDGPLLP